MMTLTKTKLSELDNLNKEFNTLTEELDSLIYKAELIRDSRDSSYSIEEQTELRVRLQKVYEETIKVVGKIRLNSKDQNKLRTGLLYHFTSQLKRKNA